MDFSKPPHGLVTPISPPKHAVQAEDDVPVGSDAGLALLAWQLNWEI